MRKWPGASVVVMFVWRANKIEKNQKRCTPGYEALQAALGSLAGGGDRGEQKKAKKMHQWQPRVGGKDAEWRAERWLDSRSVKLNRRGGSKRAASLHLLLLARA